MMLQSSLVLLNHTCIFQARSSGLCFCKLCLNARSVRVMLTFQPEPSLNFRVFLRIKWLNCPFQLVATIHLIVLILICFFQSDANNQIPILVPPNTFFDDSQSYQLELAILQCIFDIQSVSLVIHSNINPAIVINLFSLKYVSFLSSIVS